MTDIYQEMEEARERIAELEDRLDYTEKGVKEWRAVAITSLKALHDLAATVSTSPQKLAAQALLAQWPEIQ